ncbi:hypothetical protein TNCV_2400951 [Trichonephila clavipes]|nr:hypothetical protein TNCV_2400951 [Trichonephila clavipes]
MQEKLRFCSHAFLPRSTNQSGHSLPGRPTHIRPHTLSRYGMEERFAFRFPVTPSIISFHFSGKSAPEGVLIRGPLRTSYASVKYHKMLFENQEIVENRVKNSSSNDSPERTKVFPRTLFHSDLRLATVPQLVILQTFKSSSTQ